MIDLFNSFFGSLDFSTPEGVCYFLFGCLIVVGIFNLLKMVIKIVFK